MSLGKPLDKIHITGYKSIQEMRLELNDLNVLIGANGAGKSNEAYFIADYLSDGTLRFICLATLLLQPESNLPVILTSMD